MIFYSATKLVTFYDKKTVPMVKMEKQEWKRLPFLCIIFFSFEFASHFMMVGREKKGKIDDFEPRFQHLNTKAVKMTNKAWNLRIFQAIGRLHG